MYAEFNEKLLNYFFPFVAHFYRFFFFQLFVIPTDKYQLLAIYTNIYRCNWKYMCIQWPYTYMQRCTNTPSTKGIVISKHFVFSDEKAILLIHRYSFFFLLVFHAFYFVGHNFSVCFLLF